MILAALAGLAGCSSRAGTDYKGESLMHLTGKVVLQSDTRSDLVPALAYWPGTPTKDFELVDVDVTGQFPASFTLDVFEPPPDGALFYAGGDARAFPEDPRIGFAYITAVPPDHAATVPQFLHEGSSSCSKVCPNGDPTCAQTSTQSCTQTNSWCTRDHTSCYEETSDCAPDGTNCVVTQSTGDPKLKNVWADFGGLSENYIVIYVDHDAAAGSATAFTFGGRKPMSRGYHLVQVRELSAEENAAAVACAEGADAEALARYNAEHRTAYTSWPSEPIDVVGAIKLKENQILTERNCQLGGVGFTPVESGAEHPVTIQISPDAKPLDVLPGG